MGSVPIFFGESFNDFCNHSQLASGAYIAETLLNAASEEVLDATFGKDGYLISAGVLPARKTELCVDVVFRSNAPPEDEAKAYLHAILLGRALKKLQTETLEDDNSRTEAIMAVETEVNENMGVAWNLFQAGSKMAGWDLTRTEIQ